MVGASKLVNRKGRTAELLCAATHDRSRDMTKGLHEHMRERKWQGKRPAKPGDKPYRKPGRSHQGGAGRSGASTWRDRGDAPTDVILYGWHTVTAALANPARHIRRLLVTENALRRLTEEGVTLPLAPDVVRPDAIAARLTPDAVHQGLLAEADPLPSPSIEDLGSFRHRARARSDHRSA